MSPVKKGSSSSGKTGYLERYIGGIDRIETGRPGGVSADRWLVVHYRPEYAPILKRYLSYDDERVRAETVMLFTDVKEPYVAETVRTMSIKDTEMVRGACIGYLSVFSEIEEKIPLMLDTIRYKRGEEFSKAAGMLGSIGRIEDIETIRRSYGMVKGSMRNELFDTLSRIIDRHPEMEQKRNLILSLPVRPDEDAFDRFLSKSIEYLDVRYRGNIFPEKNISATSHNNVASALNKMNIRLYNEADNLNLYCAGETERADLLADLIAWATKDLAGKIVRESEVAHRCPRCSNDMVFYNGIWSCPHC